MEFEIEHAKFMKESVLYINEMLSNA